MAFKWPDISHTVYIMMFVREESGPLRRNRFVIERLRISMLLVDTVKVAYRSEDI